MYIYSSMLFCLLPPLLLKVSIASHKFSAYQLVSKLNVVLATHCGYSQYPLIICKCVKHIAHALQLRTHTSPRGITEHWDKLVIKSRYLCSL